MKQFYVLFAGLLIYSISYAQKITVVDNTSLQPLEKVAIVGKSLASVIYTNNKGQAEVSALNSDTLHFYLLGYLKHSASMKEISRKKNIVSLSSATYSLEEIVVSSSRFEEKRKDVPQQIQVISAKELAFQNQPTMADVMQSSGNVLVQKSQHGGGSPVIRGFEANKVLMVVDGVRMNNAIYRGGHLQNIITLDNATMEKVEIVFGPGSVMYGSDALGGVMHFYTKSPQLADSGIHFKGSAFTRYATASSEKTGHVDFTIAGTKFGSLTSITYSDFDDLRAGRNRNPFYGNFGARTFYVERVNGVDSVFRNEDISLQKQSGYSQYDVMQKFLLRQNDKVFHHLNLQYSSSSDVPRYDRLTQTSGGKPRFAQWYYGPQERLFGSYALNIYGDSTFYDHVRAILAYQDITESRHDRRFRNHRLNHRTENVDVYTLNVDASKKSGKHEIRYGIEGSYNSVSSKADQENILTGERKPLDTRYPSGGSSMQHAAAYLSHTFEISPKFILTEGVRFTNVQLKATFDDTTFFPFPFRDVKQQNNAINGNVGLVLMPGKDWRFTLTGSSGFRAPNVDDLSKVFESTPGNVIVPNPDLGPEYTYNADLGISKVFGGKVTAGGTAFYTWYTDAITVKPANFNGSDSIVYSGQLSRVTMNQNANKAYLYGFNAFLAADVTEHFSIESSLNYTYARIVTDTADYPLDHIPPVFGRTSFNLKLHRFRSEFFVLYNGTKASWNYNLFGEDNETNSADPVRGYMPAWVTLNLRASFQFNKYFQIQGGVENILDEHYRVFASNISAPGRNFSVTLRATF